MPIRTTTKVDLGKVRTKTNAWAPMLAALQTTTTFSLFPPATAGKKKRRPKKKR